MTEFTLAGPDIGVRRTDIAGLYKELGEEMGLWAAQQATEIPIEVPFQKERRIVRLHKDGDAAQGWHYFERRLKREDAPPAPEPPPPPETTDEDVEVEDEQRLVDDLCEPLIFINPQHAADEFHANPENVKVWRVPVSFTIEVDTSMLVRAPDKDLAYEAAGAVLRNRVMPEGTDAYWESRLALQEAFENLEKSEDYEEAEWNPQVNADIKRFDPREVLSLLRHMVKIDVERFREAAIERAGNNVDFILASEKGFKMKE